MEELSVYPLFLLYLPLSLSLIFLPCLNLLINLYPLEQFKTFSLLEYIILSFLTFIFI